MLRARLLPGLAALFALAWLVAGWSAVWLSDPPDARWIVPREPFRLGARAAGPREAIFRKTFALSAPGPVDFSVRALKQARVFVDGKEAVAPVACGAGTHELKIAVLNVDGPDALLVRSATPGVATGVSWEASRDDATWGPAAEASALEAPELSERFESPGRALLAAFPVLAAAFALVFAWSWTAKPRVSASTIRWLCMAAWVALWLRDAPLLPLNVGYDVKGHLEYMAFVLARRALPTPADGWQTFQAPLYYVLSLPFFAASLARDDAAARVLLRLIPCACGLAQIELSYRAARLLFPGRGDLHAAAAALGGFMPMSLYLDLYIGNEPLAAALTSAALVAALSKKAVWAGVALGLALLTKASALLAVIPVAAFLAAASSKPRWKEAGRALGVAALIAGWFYAWRWMQTGSFAALSSYGRVSLGEAGGAGWWQDPGYRTWGQLFSFGRALSRPVYASTSGFLDSLYSTAWLDGLLSSMTTFESRPPWNESFHMALAWMSLAPAGLILVGIARASRLRDARRKAFAFVAACVVVYVGAVLALWLRFPIYSMAKATYTAGLIPFYAVLGCLGLERLARGRVARALAGGWLAAWAACAWLAFFIR